MNVEGFRARRHDDGSIDFDFYRHRATALRRLQIRLLRRQLPARLALYAGALCVGLLVGEVLPLQTGDCLNCHHVGVDIDDARRAAVAQDSTVTIVSRHPIGWP